MAKQVIAQITGGDLKADEHVFSILLTDQSGNPLPLYYTKNTSVTSDSRSITVTLTFGKDEVIPPDAKVYILVDTYPIDVK